MVNNLASVDYNGIYFYVYYIAIAVIFVAELLVPKRALQHSYAVRWLNNIGLSVVSGYLLRLLLPIAGIDLALRLEAEGIGLLNLLSVPFLLKLICGVLILDLMEYGLHRLYHKFLILWRCHLVHHADPDVDFTTHVRHHPLEALISLGVNLLVIFMLGIPAIAIFVYSIAAHAVSLFSHGNIALPAGLDRVLRRFIITPDMHRVHHSIDKPETNSNYGIVFPWWDHLFNSYVAQPKKGHLDMQLGLDRFRTRRDLFVDRLLILPFAKQAKQRAKPVADVK